MKEVDKIMISLKRFFYIFIFILIIIVVKLELIEFYMFEMFIIMPLLCYISSKDINYDEKLIVNYFGTKSDLNEDKINYIKNIYKEKIKKNSILVLCMTPFVYYIEFFVSSDCKIYNIFFLNRVLQIPFLLAAIILLLSAPIFVKKTIF